MIENDLFDYYLCIILSKNVLYDNILNSKKILALHVVHESSIGINN